MGQKGTFGIAFAHVVGSGGVAGSFVGVADTEAEVRCDGGDEEGNLWMILRICWRGLSRLLMLHGWAVACVSPANKLIGE